MDKEENSFIVPTHSPKRSFKRLAEKVTFYYCSSSTSSSTSSSSTVIARSALYVRAHSQNWNVSASVRPFVRKVITFCKEDMRGNHVPVGNGVLNDRFFRF